MNNKQKTVLFRFLRTLAAAAIAGVIAVLTGSEAAHIIPAGAELWVALGLVPILTTVEKTFRYGSDGAENPALSLVPRRPDDGSRNRDAGGF